MRAILAILVVLGSCSACGGKDSGCTPNETQPCLCPGGGTGVQTCNEEGTAWSTCDCAGTDTSTDPDAPADLPPGEPGCTSDEDCDDADPCTTDSCDPFFANCLHEDIDADGDGATAARIGDTDCGGSDCDDTRDDIYPGAPEDSCYDGLDQDCHGITGPQMLIEDVVLLEDAATGHPLNLSWTGSEFGLLWHDGESILFNRLSIDGSRMMADVELGVSTVRDSDLDWSGSTFGIIWVESPSDVTVAAIEADGTVVSSGRTLGTSNLGAVTIAWSGSTFGTAWRSPTGLRFDPVGADGADLGGGVDVPLSWSNDAIDMVWTGSEFALSAYSPSNEVRLQRLSAAGDALGTMFVHSSVVVDNGTARDNLAWNGSEIGLAWKETTGPMFARLDADASPIGSAVSIDHPGASGISTYWTGSRFMLVWAYDGITLARFDAEGNRVGDDVLLSESMRAAEPTMSWTGSEFGFVWYDGGTTHSLTFNRVGWCD